MLNSTEELHAMEDVLLHLEQAIDCAVDSELSMNEASMACKELHIAPDFRECVSSVIDLKMVMLAWRSEIEAFIAKQPDPDAYDESADRAMAG